MLSVLHCLHFCVSSKIKLMCRLFGYKGHLPTKLSFFLVDASNALVKQSILDARNISNSQGWGIGFYHNGRAFIQKRASSASFDFNFKFLTDFIETNTMVAHIRDATVGEISDHNTHPFLYNNWIFAHNGTIQGFELMRPIILQKIGPELAFEIMGTTDSEYLFYLFIANLKKKVPDVTSIDIDTLVIRDTFIETIREINNLGANIGIIKPHKLNAVITNGKIMTASRYGNSLFYTTRTKAMNEDVKLYKDDTNLKIRFNSCIDNYCRIDNDSVIIASEQLNKEDNWYEVPEQSVLIVDEKFRISLANL